jgi:hypothetical protein
MLTTNRFGALRRCLPAAIAGLALVALAGAISAQDQPAPKDMGNKPKPVAPPADAKVLFGGKEADLDNWDGPRWEVKDGYMIAKGGSIKTKDKFGDCQLHVEFKTPYMPDKKGQARGNSGVILQDAYYEIQVLDSYGLPDPGTGDCGAVYSQSAPLTNACKPPLSWQTYDIIFRAARFDDQGNVTAKPRVTVIQNGIVVQNNTEIQGRTADHGPFNKEPGFLELQDHGNPVQYRNVWIKPLPLKGADHY